MKYHMHDIITRGLYIFTLFLKKVFSEIFDLMYGLYLFFLAQMFLQLALLPSLGHKEAIGTSVDILLNSTRLTEILS